jgi:hypothetical protein
MIAGFGTHTITAFGSSNGCSVTSTMTVQVIRDADLDGIHDGNDRDDDNDGILDVVEICGTATGDIQYTVKIKPDKHGSEITWTLKNTATGATVGSGGPYPNNNQGLKTINLTLPSDAYTFEINDQYGDGICCRYGNGYYEISINSKIVIGGSNSNVGAFTFSKSHAIPAPAFWCLASDPALDDDNDGIPNYQDAQFCSLANGVCASMDLDGDGLINSLDTDSDGDGCFDVFEAGFSDLDDNGILDGSVVNSAGLFTVNSDGYSIATTVVYNASLNPCQDMDGDGVPDMIDIDDDGDGLPDLLECPIPLDTDGDGKINSRDIDSDGDGIPDVVEAQATTGYIMPTGLDSDGDGLDNAFDDNCLGCPISAFGITLIPYNHNQGTDDIPDYLDTDSDDDGTPDQIEAWDFNVDGIPETVASGIDRDRDGLDDGFDLDTSNFNIFGSSNGGMRAQDLPNHDGLGEPDFRNAMTTLPIELLAFDAKENGDERVLVTWITAAEINNDYFTVERSMDGQEWILVRTLPGAGNSSSILMYETYDSEPYTGISYYRLKQTDFDGQFTYSPIRAVQMDERAKVEVFPNPSDTYVNVFVGTSKNVKMKFIDSMGREHELVVEDFGPVQQILVSSMAPGTYLLYLDDGTKIDVQVVVIY